MNKITAIPATLALTIAASSSANAQEARNIADNTHATFAQTLKNVGNDRVKTTENPGEYIYCSPKINDTRFFSDTVEMGAAKAALREKCGEAQSISCTDDSCKNENGDTTQIPHLPQNVGLYPEGSSAGNPRSRNQVCFAVTPKVTCHTGAPKSAAEKRAFIEANTKAGNKMQESTKKENDAKQAEVRKEADANRSATEKKANSGVTDIGSEIENNMRAVEAERKVGFGDAHTTGGSVLDMNSNDFGTNENGEDTCVVQANAASALCETLPAAAQGDCRAEAAQKFLSCDAQK